MAAFERFALAALAATSILLVSGPPAAAAQIAIPPIRDNSLFSDGADASCGFGPLFAGDTGAFGSRRTVIAFDVAGSIPPGSTVTGVALEMTVENAGPFSSATDVFRLHRLLADWGEAASACGGGVGAPAEVGDATWIYRFFDTDSWSTAGGDFNGTASGSAAVPTSGTATWPSQPAMVADVQSWLDAPSSNFGWIIVGNESAPRTARRFPSREGSPSPSLRIDYTSPPATPPAVPDGQSGSPVLLSKLSADGANLLVAWDTSLCSGDTDHHILFGTRSGFPAAPGGNFTLSGSVCDLGASSPFVWTGSPDPAVLDPGARLLFVLVVADDGATTEGSWGRSSLLQERNGPGANGCSSQCGVLDKSLANTCGNAF